MATHLTEPWEFAEQLSAATDQERVLKDIRPEDPFWIGASYSVDPFVGVIYHLPLRNPHHHERGLAPEMFDTVARAILSGDLHGDRLTHAMEALSRACTPDQWQKWYRPILEGNLDLRLPLAVFNKYTPNPIAPPALNKPKSLTRAAAKDYPNEFFLQPVHENRCFWLVNSKIPNMVEVRGYDEHSVRLRDPLIENSLTELGKNKPIDVVIIGYLTDQLVVDDLVPRDQFSREACPYPLYQRLEAANKLGLPLIQRSNILTPKDVGVFHEELRLIFEQKFSVALLRDFNGSYPFRVQCDWKLTARSWAKT